MNINVATREQKIGSLEIWWFALGIDPRNRGVEGGNVDTLSILCKVPFTGDKFICWRKRKKEDKCE